MVYHLVMGIVDERDANLAFTESAKLEQNVKANPKGLEYA
jgi:hypothetical protein